MLQPDPDTLRLFNEVFAATSYTLDHTYFWDAGVSGDYAPAVKNRRLSGMIVACGKARFTDPEGRRCLVLDAGCGEVFVLCHSPSETGVGEVKLFAPMDYRTYIILPAGSLRLQHARWLLQYPNLLRTLRQECRQMREEDTDKSDIIDHVERAVEFQLPYTMQHTTPMN